MLKRVLSNTWTTVGLLTLIILASSYLVWLPTSNSVDADNTIGEIVYLTNDDLLDVPLLPNTLDVQKTRNWSTIEASANAGLLDAVIIHQDAKDKVNVESLKRLFRHNNVVVVGMGVADEQLTQWLDLPANLNDTANDVPNDFYYMYAFHISGTADDIATYEQAERASYDEAVEGIENPLEAGLMYNSDLLGNGLFAEYLNAYILTNQPSSTLGE